MGTQWTEIPTGPVTGEGGKDGAGEEPMLSLPASPAPSYPALPFSGACPDFPLLGLATPVEGEQLPGAWAPGGRTHSSHGSRGAAPGTGLQRRTP